MKNYRLTETEYFSQRHIEPKVRGTESYAPFAKAAPSSVPRTADQRSDGSTCLRVMKFAILFFALFFAACNNIFETPKPQNTETGYFSLSIGKAARTIMPEFALNDFAAYTLEFTEDGGETEKADKTAANLSEPVALSAGTWKLTVSAFLAADDTEAAAQGSLEGIVIEEGKTLTGSVSLEPLPISGGGTGTFSWKIEFAADLSVTAAGMTITPLDTATGTAAETYYFIGGTPLIDMDGEDASLELNAGYYRVVFNLTNDEGKKTQQRQMLHVYTGKDSFFEFTFEDKHFNPAVLLVTNENDDGEGSLRKTIADAPPDSIIAVDSEQVHTIALTARLTVDKNLTIEGNGVTISGNNSSQLMYVSGTSTEATIRRVWFKDGRTTGNGGAIVSNGNLTLESCIFSGNRTTGTSAYGGVIYNSNGTLNVKGCTFYNNSSAYWGGAIYNFGTATLAGNLFYGNTASVSPVAGSGTGGTVTSSYNAVDVNWGTGSTPITRLPVSPASFRLLSGSEAAEIITDLPDDYPFEDFYGNPIPDSHAAAGAVQGVTAEGFYLGLTYEADRGSVSVVTPPDNDGLYADGTDVTLTATADGFSLKWLVNGEKAEGGENTLTLTMTEHAFIQAVFYQEWVVDNASGSETTEGTLRHAVSNALDGDIIQIKLDAPDNVITLAAGLSINCNITIEGNGVTISGNNNVQLMNVTADTEVTISRVHFKDGRATSSGATSSGGAIYNNGNLTLESCIFSNNQTTRSDSNGGAIANGSTGSPRGTLNVKGCTFYNNSAGSRGGAIDNYDTVTLVGNLFYANTSTTYPVVGNYAGSVTSRGYNVYDAASPGFTTTGNKRITRMPVAPVSLKLLDDSGAAGVITALPDDYPAFDFYGDPIEPGAAAGAVQSLSPSASGYYLGWSVNNSVAGSVGVSPAPDTEGLYAADSTVRLTASPSTGYTLNRWEQDGADIGNTSPLDLPMTDHTAVEAVFTKLFTVSNPSDASGSATVEGTLRHAMTNARDEDIISINLPDPNVIELISRLPDIRYGIIIEGNGVTITRDAGMAVNTTSQLMSVSAGTARINGVHFKGGRSASNGGAISKTTGGNLTLESCIFSGNQSGTNGGAIFTQGGTLNVKGCTFYNNSAGNSGGAIYNINAASRVTLEGNLFYANTAVTGYPVVYRQSGTVTSLGYNVVDKEIGDGTDQSGWAEPAAGLPRDSGGEISSLPVVPGGSFRLLPGSAAAGVIDALPADYPAKDFHGQPITVLPAAAAGAVQGTAAASGFYLDLSVNDTSRGSVSGSPAFNADSMYTTLSLTASPNTEYAFYWLQNGENKGSGTFSLTLTDHTTVVRAVFYKVFTVTIFTDTATSATTEGTLRHAMTNAQNDDVIRIMGTAGQTITTRSGLKLPDIDRRITIEGNGVIINGDRITIMNVVAGGTAYINGVHFRNGNGTNGGVISNNGNLTLESCIFSGNQSNNGAIYNDGSSAVLNVKGCTFYNNSSGNHGAAISCYGVVTLAGNLFYGNTAPTSPVVYRQSGTVTVTSLGYNVVDVTLGATNTATTSGFDGVTGDTTFAALGIDGEPFDTTTFVPVPGLGAVINDSVWAAANMPARDFNGDLRTWTPGGAPGAVK